jgi:uncharacterized repeat protein (TIGR01451 family)
LTAVAALAAAAFGRADAAQLGARVDNVAVVSFTLGATNATVTTPPASFVIEAARTPSTIEFFRYAPNAPDAIAVRLNGSDFQPGSGGFQPVGPLRAAGGAVVNTAAPVNLAPASAYYTGEPVIIRVADAGQNGDPNVVETLVATIRTANGDFVALRLYESGPDTGEFYAWIPSGAGAPIQNDASLTLAHGANLTARYQDPFDPTEISTDAAGVDPFGRLFDSLTGALINGATVTIVDDATGLPAQVFGIDGVSAYPSTIVTGSSVTDAGGMVYSLSPGEFRFPIMVPGSYRLLVTPPAGYTAPSTVAAPAFAGLSNAPFTIIPASYAQAFTLSATGDVEFDVPLDPLTDLVVLKTADVDAAAIGDFVRYRISIENRAATAVPVRIADALPAGFRYQQGSARLDGAPAGDPQIAANGGTLTFALGLAQPGTTLELVYVAEVGPGAKAGAAVNRATAVSQNGVVISNRAEASVLIEDDFLRASLTIVGRIVEDGCDVENGGAKNLRAGKGLAGVRLYMETGATVVSDENGLYHFEDVSPRTHVVQVDEESLPDGYELVQCLDTTRYAGSPRSQFVDAKGGKLWRANFYLRKVEGSAPPLAGGLSAKRTDGAPSVASGDTSPASGGGKTAFNADKEYLAYDKIWLNQQPAGNAFAYPADGVTPSSPSVNIGLKHDAKLRPTLFLNGREVAIENYAGRDVSIMRTVALTRWKGVDLLDGVNRFEAVLKDPSGAEIARLSRNVDFINRVERAVLVPEETKAFADGKTRPVIAVRVTDGGGRPVRAGRQLAVEIAPPFRAATREAIEQSRPLDAPLSAKSGVPVGQNGVALIELEPTVETGLATVKVKLDDGSEKTFTAYVKPALRDFIIVGLAEGEASYEKEKGPAATKTARDLMTDGRIAGFAKGTVKGGWLVTVAGDSKNERGPADEDLFEVIDPDDRYPLYGDRSNQKFEAQSRYPVYLKAEKDGFKAEFGDYATGLTQSKLSRYDRRLSGLNTVYESERLQFRGFAAETNQAFVKDELAADGTSGPYRLSATPLVRNSEKITVETRDRFRPDVTLASVPLIRYADYDIDFQSGEIIFRLPVPAADAAFNPNVIVIDYETAAPVDRNLTAGGRGAVRFLGGRAEAGATFIHEEAPGVTGERANLAGGDLEIDLTEKDNLRIEYATTLRDGPGLDERADAILAEVSHTGDRLSAKGYYSRVEPEFGLAQQTSATAGVLRYGAEASFKFEEFESKEGTTRGARYVDAKAYREKNLDTDASREVAEIGLRQESTSTSGAVGLRGVREEPAGGPAREGLFAVAALKQRFDKLGLSLRAAREQAISGDDASALFPTRTSLGFDQKLFEGFTLSATHEILDGDTVSQSNTTVGLAAEPWTGGKVTVSGDRLTQESAERIGATFAVDQQVRLSDAWTGSLGLARREDLRERGAVDAPDDIVPDIPRSPFEETGGAYTSLYVGAGYRHGATSGSSRFEMKKSETGQRYMLAAGAARDLSEELSFAAAGRYQADNNEFLSDERRFDARIGASWRPHDDGLIILNRFDVKQRERDQDSESWKAVHNLTVNAMATEKLQIALNHGLKYSVLRADGLTHDGVTELLGLEARYDVRDWLDVGVHGEAIYAFNAETIDYAYGPMIGVTPAENIWFSFGWNFAGFIDEDFAAAEFSRVGPYLKLRIKFDQTTARGLLDAISPERGQ